MTADDGEMVSALGHADVSEALAGAYDAIVLASVDGRIRQMNAAAEDFCERQFEELRGQRLGEVFEAVGLHSLDTIQTVTGEGRAWIGTVRARGVVVRANPKRMTVTRIRRGSDERDLLLVMITAMTGVATGDGGDQPAEAVSDALVVTDVRGIVTSWNSGAEQVLGLAAADLVGQSLQRVAAPDTVLARLPWFADVVAGGAIDGHEVIWRRGDGSSTRLTLSAVPVRGVDGAIGAISMVIHDLNERMALVAARRDAEDRFQAAFGRSAFPMLVADLNRRPMVVNQAMCDLLARSAEELVGRSWAPFGHPDDPHLGQSMHDARVGLSNDFYSDQRRYLRPDGSVIWVQLFMTLVRDGDGEPAYYMTQFMDITAPMQLRRELERRSLYDELTGLPNRVLLGDRLDQALAGAASDESLSGVAFVNIDGFKHVNDVHGHAVGDILLVQLAERIVSTVSPGDTVARFGGDAFVVVAHRTSLEALAETCHRITVAMAEPFHLAAGEVTAGVAVGMTLSRPGSTSRSLLSEADAALHLAKSRGRGQMAFYDDSLRERAFAQLEGERRLRDALDAGQIVAFYQPIVDMRSGTTIGVEALARWREDDGTIVAPQAFVPLAESTGLITEVDKAVLRRAVGDMVDWRADHPQEPGLSVSVNLSARHIADHAIVRTISDLLASSGFPPDQLQLEITETTMMVEVGRSVEVLEDLKRLGVRVAIDDFGTGYSSLAYLRQLAVDTLKIDRSFVSDLTRTGDVVIVRSIIALAAALGVSCVAEGVETQEQLVSLIGLGCHLAQGYYYSRPLSSLAAALTLPQQADIPG